MSNGKYRAAWNLALSALRGGNLEDICSRTGAESSGDTIRIRYFSDLYSITLPDGCFSPSDLGEGEKILILHYLVSKGASTHRGRYVTFKGLPGGMFYYSTFRKRGAERLLSVFGDNPENIIPASRRACGTEADFGDVSVKFQVFPSVEVVVVLYRGDEEFPPDAAILFKDDIIDYLSLEDTAYLSGVLAGRLIY